MKTREQLKKTIVDQLSWDNRVNANDVKVKIDSGRTVKLSGTVSSYTEKITAGDIAWSVIGVNNVDNKIKVEFPAEFTVPSDEDIQSSIKDRLLERTDIDSIGITVNVSNGLVNLEGSVPTYWQKTSAEDEARLASGVVSVTNKLAVVPTEKVTDEIVGERVISRIADNTVADVDNLDVKVKNGVVTLNGEVINWDTWRSVYNAAQYTTGVVSVDDQLSIKYA